MTRKTQEQPPKSTGNQQPGEKPPKNKGGRPSKLTAEIALNIFLLGRKGLTDAEIAQVVGVDERTINNWKKSPEFFQSLKEAKEQADAIIERSLFERAAGYEHSETKVFVHEGKIITKDITKHVPPDPACIIFWLKNRNPDRWREKIPELANLADSLGSVLQQLRKHAETKPRKKDDKKSR